MRFKNLIFFGGWQEKRLVLWGCGDLGAVPHVTCFQRLLEALVILGCDSKNRLNPFGFLVFVVGAFAAHFF